MKDDVAESDAVHAGDDVLGFDELQVDDFLERRSADDVAAMVGDLEIVADIETGDEAANHELAPAPVHLQVTEELEIEGAIVATGVPNVSVLTQMFGDDDDALTDELHTDEMDIDAMEKNVAYDREQFRRAIEAIVMVSEIPVTTDTLSELLQATPSAIDELCAEISAEYESQARGFVLTRVAGGYRYASHPAMADYVEQFVLDGQNARLSGAALETLAIVAYKQPVSRAQIAAIRGVNVDGVVRTLESRGWIGEIAKDSGPGQAILYGTTPLFLEKLGLVSVNDLPPLGEFMPQADVLDVLERTLAGGERDARTLRAEPLTGDDINELVHDDANG
jgi:segregation and condensation protein B